MSKLAFSYKLELSREDLDCWLADLLDGQEFADPEELLQFVEDEFSGVLLSEAADHYLDNLEAVIYYPDQYGNIIPVRVENGHDFVREFESEILEFLEQ